MTKITSSIKFITALAALATVASANAGTIAVGSGKGKSAPSKIESTSEKSVFDKIWGLAKLYKSDTGFLNELAFTGRYHGQYHDTEADDDLGSASEWDNRRFRLGLQAILADKKLALKAEMFGDLNSGGEFYEGLTELHLGFRPNGDESLVFTIGKQKPRFGQEWSTSSRLIPTFERSRITNQFKPDYSAGLSVSGKSGNVLYYVGAFANDAEPEMAGLDGGNSYIASIGYDLKDSVGSERAIVRADFIHSSHEEADTIFTAFDNGLSLSFDYKQGDVGFVTEAQYGEGEKSAFGISLTPTYNLSKEVQLVARYQFGTSSDEGGLTAQKRYEQAAGLKAGDQYNALYLGVNYFIYDHKLKLMAGAEYADLDGAGESLSFLAGVRAYW